MKKERRISLTTYILTLVIMVIVACIVIGIIINQGIGINTNNLAETNGEAYELNQEYSKEVSDGIIFNIKSNDEFKISTEDFFHLENEDKSAFLETFRLQYNFENFTLEYFINNVLGEDLDSEDIINQGKITENIYMIVNDFGERIKTEYIIQSGDLFCVSSAYYENEDIYNQYNELFNEMIKTLSIEDSNDITEYKEIANMDSSYERAYNNLNSEKKEIYDEMYNQLIIKKDCYGIDNINKTDAEKYMNVFDALCKDSIALQLEHFTLGEASGYDQYGNYSVTFWFDDYNENQIYLNCNGPDVCGSCTIAENENDCKIIEETVNNIIENMPDGLTTLGKYKYLADCICNLTEYSDSGSRSYTGAGVFVDGKAVCQGYSLAYAYLCKKAGLFCETMGADSEATAADAHGWNYIKIGDKFYFVDTTWGDTIGCDYKQFAFMYDKNDKDSSSGHYNYISNYFNELSDNFYDTDINDISNNLGIIDWRNKILIY